MLIGGLVNMVYFNRIMRIVFCIPTLVVLLIGVTCMEGNAQRDSLWLLHKKKRKEMLGLFMHTNHGYFGVEGGLILDLGSTSSEDPSPGLFPNQTAYLFQNDIDVFNNFRIFGGYNYRQHYFELSTGQVYSSLDFSIKNSGTTSEGNYKYGPGYWAVTTRYFYALPIRLRNLRLLVGTEAGVGIPGRFGATRHLFKTYGAFDYEVQSGGAIFITGLNIRADVKLARNFTLFGGFNATVGIPGSEVHSIHYYILDSPSGSAIPITSRQRSSVLNLNFNIGFKLDFYSPRDAGANFSQLQLNKISFRQKRTSFIRSEQRKLISAKPIRPVKKRTETICSIANRTFHGYFGIEGGLLLNMGPTSSPHNEGIVNNSQAILYGLESMRFFAGIAFPNHHIELGMGSAMSRVRVDIPSYWYKPWAGTYGFNERYLNVFARYYYRIPIPSSRFRLLIGPEIGLGIHLDKDSIRPEFAAQPPGYPYTLRSTGNSGKFIGLLGVNTRLDTKLARNFTLFVQTSVTGGFGASLDYELTYINGWTPSSGYFGGTGTFNGSILNVNFTLGLKFDFYRKGQLEKISSSSSTM